MPSRPRPRNERLTDEQRAAAARALLDAETEHSPIDAISTTYPDADVEDAYRISMAVTALKLARGRTIKGHKIGLTSKPMQQLVGTTEPDYGSIFDDWFVLEGSTVDMARLNRPLVEVEIAFVLGTPLAGSTNNAADVIRATDFVLPAIEIVDTRYRGYGTNLLVDSIADAASCGLVVLGSRPMRLTDFDLRREGAALYKNGTVEESGVAAAVMGNPVNAVVWLVNQLGEFGVPMEAGNVILSGSFLKAIPFTAGDTIAALFDTLGDVTFATA
jgi:2-keto-4-pentenoate hydratase